MPRKPRLFIPACIHHVMARGLDGMDIFRDNADRSRFLKLFSERITKTDCRCYAWVLMRNHFHLVLRTGGEPLWKLMKPLNSIYAGYFNKKYERRGYLFQDRFKSIATQEQHYIERLIRYVHLNPIRAGLCADLDELDCWRWSGHGTLMGNASSDFQDTRTVLLRFGKRLSDARKNYRTFLEQGLIGKDADFEDRIRYGTSAGTKREDPGRWVIGEPQFVRNVLTRARVHRIRLARFAAQGMDLQWMHHTVTGQLGLSPESMLRRARSGSCAQARKIFAYLSNKELDISVASIARYLSVDSSAVSRMIPQGKSLVEKLGVAVSLSH